MGGNYLNRTSTSSSAARVGYNDGGSPFLEANTLKTMNNKNTYLFGETANNIALFPGHPSTVSWQFSADY